jgi:EF-P beta-lysylation protein EpmB
MTPLNATSAWQKALVQAITDPQELLSILELDQTLLPAAKAVTKQFPLIVPRGFVARMQKGNPDDPLLRQILAIDAELIETPGFKNDPLGEADVNPVPGLLHKYHGRVLLTFVGTCAVNCRFCFRRHFPYVDNNPSNEGWDQALAYIASDPSINEVILSGGDPLIANDKKLLTFTEKLNQIPHVKRLRIHSRMPIVLPERITNEFIAWSKTLRQQVIMVTHCNHPQEINDTVIQALNKMREAGMVLLNHTVLLKGVNDNVDTLVALSEALFQNGVQPYYLHMLDKVQGAAHFAVDVTKGKALHWAITQQLSGYMVPKFVYEKAGAPAKISLGLYTD